MAIDVEHLRQHYASLSDEEFDNLDRSDLTEVAQKCYDNELARRSLRRSPDEISETERDRKTPPDDPVEFPDEEPFVACAFGENAGLRVLLKPPQRCKPPAFPPGSNSAKMNTRSSCRMD